MLDNPEAVCFVDVVFVVDLVRTLPSQQSKRMTQVGSHRAHEVRKVHQVAGNNTRKVNHKPL
jgi:hypothetical protein